MVRDPEDWFDIRSEGSLQMGLIGGDGYHIFLGFDFSAGEIPHCYLNHSVFFVAKGWFCLLSLLVMILETV